MKIWWVIVNDQYYPSFGLDDVKATFNTFNEALQFADTNWPERTSLYVEIINIQDRL